MTTTMQRTLLGTTLAVLLAAPAAQADPLTWVGGPGTWDFNNTANWDNGGPVTWTDEAGDDTAIFNTPAGAVTVDGTGSTDGTITTNGMTFNVNGYNLSGGTITLAGTTPTIQVTTAGHTATISSTLTGAGFTKSGAGVLTLGGANGSYSGAINLSTGQLNLASASALGTGALTIAGGTTIGKAISGGGDLTLTTNNAMNWNGNFTLAAGSNNNHLNMGTGAVTLGGNITVNETSNGTGRFTVGGIISDGGNNYSLTVTGAGSAAQQLILSGVNSYGGGTVVTSGGLGINNNSALGTGSLTMNGGWISTPTGQSRNISNTVILNSSLFFGNHNAQNASGTLTLSAATLSLPGNRGITVQQGTLIVGSVIDDGGSSFAITYTSGDFAGSTFRLAAANSFDGGLTVKSGGHRANFQIANAGALGTGTFILTGNSSANAVNKSIRITNSTASPITLSTNNAQDWDTDFIFGMSDGGGTSGQALNLGTGAVSLGTTSATATRTINVHSATLTAGGIISDGTTTNGITKIGGGTLALAGANAYTGATVVNAGTLRVDPTGALANASVSVDGGTFTGTGTVNFNLDATPDLMALLAGTLNVSGLTINFVGPATEASYLLVDYSAGGTFTTAVNALTDNTFAGVTNLPTNYEFFHDTTNKMVFIQAIPEPASLALLGLGGLMMIGRGRGKRRRD
ncbi:MAG: autotransporter-associated beta strand repeat-containing protein [Phycisphaeraceae bacterium]